MAEEQEGTKHSKLGVASFLIGIGIMTVSGLLILIFMSVSEKNKFTEFENDFMIFAVFFVYLISPAAHFIGLILGGLGWMQKARRKGLAIAGFMINLVLLCILLWVQGYFRG